ncbi:hypothetical protein ACHWQZ_G006085 [Mnemiopsis leidyi]
MDDDNIFDVDDLNKIRVLDNETSTKTAQLKEECKDFIDKIDDFQTIVGGFIDLMDNLSTEVEREKLKAIGARNLLKSMAKQRESQQQQLVGLIHEKKTQLERYRIQLQSLEKTEAEQRDFIDQFILQK